MIALDTNVLLHAHRGESPFHATALEAFRRVTVRPWALPWPCLHEFLAVATHPRVYDPPTPMPEALATMDAWLTAGRAVVIGEGPGYFERLSGLLAASGVTGARVHDARIAALCLHHGVGELLTADRDFGRFPALKTRNPLV